MPGICFVTLGKNPPGAPGLGGEKGVGLLASGHTPGKSAWVVDGPSLKKRVTLLNQALATAHAVEQATILTAAP